MSFRFKAIIFVFVFTLVFSYFPQKTEALSVFSSIKNGVSDLLVIINSSIVRITKDGFCSRYYRDLENGSYITKIRERSALEICSNFVVKDEEKSPTKKQTPIEEKKTSSDKTISDILNVFSPISEKYLNKNISEIEKVQAVENKVEPLRESLPDIVIGDLSLSSDGIFKETNRQRKFLGLSELVTSKVLNNVAIERMNDMFSLGYFDHTSPSGETVGVFAKREGYKYLVIGENIALGDFSSNTDLISAWMASPGHKANILNQNYKEIGIAVSANDYQGHKTIIAVQVFAKPSSLCAYPDETIKSRVFLYSDSLKNLVLQADKMRIELEAMKLNGLSAVDYNNKVNEYNTIAKSANNLSLEVRTLTEKYNFQVKSYNDCIDKI